MRCRQVVGLWREDLRKINPKAAEALADPSQYANLFPNMAEALQAESLQVGTVSDCKGVDKEIDMCLLLAATGCFSAVLHCLSSRRAWCSYAVLSRVATSLGTQLSTCSLITLGG